MGYSDPPSLNILTQDILFEKLPKRMTTEVEEVVVDTDPLQPKNFCPDPRQYLLYRSMRCLDSAFRTRVHLVGRG